MAVLMDDATTTLATLRTAVARFVAERAWEPFHRPRALAIALAVEAAELLELFLWTEGEDPSERPGTRPRLEEEMADVLVYLLALANALDVDLGAAFESKMARNAERYPADRYRGIPPGAEDDGR